MKDDNSKWEEYKLHIDLYKFYMDIALKANLFFYAISGGILTYCLGKYKDVNLIKYSLLLPILMSIVFGGIFIYGARTWYRVMERMVGSIEKPTGKFRRKVFYWIAQFVAGAKRHQILKIDVREELKEVQTPSLQMLFWLLLIFGILFFIVGASMAGVLFLMNKGIN
jgi:hypothetical protein